MMFVLYITAVIFFIIGIGIRFFKWYFLIAGYNTMSEEKKKNVDIEGLGKLMGNFCIITAILLLISGIAQEQGNRLLMTISIFSIFPLSIILIILAQKYGYNKGKTNKGEAKIAVGFNSFILVLVFGMLLYGAREPKIEVENDRITIRGMYGRTIDREDIVELSLQDNIPRILNKTNGFDLGYILRGNFRLENIGSAILFINERSSPYIVIKTEDRYYIINYKDSNKTMDLYNKIK